MTNDQQNTCIALLLTIAFNSDPAALGIIPSIARKLLSTLPSEEVAKAAGTPIDFNSYFDSSKLQDGLLRFGTD